MARTNTRPQATKPRYDDLDTFGRRDGSVSQRNAVYHGKKDPHWIPFATRVYRDAGWDTALIDEEEIDPDVDQDTCACIGPCIYPRGTMHPTAQIRAASAAVTNSSGAPHSKPKGPLYKTREDYAQRGWSLGYRRPRIG